MAKRLAISPAKTCFSATGYGVIGACEDQDLSDLRSQFETNFFGTLNIIQLSLPLFRAQNAGRYLIFSSTSGALGVPGLGPYCATKYAVEGLIESMLYEVDTFQIKATLVAPGHLRLDEPVGYGPKALEGENADSNGNVTKYPHKLPTYGHFLLKKPSFPYAHQNSPAGHAKRMVQWMNDNQPTSAVKSAEVVWQLGHCKYPPLRLLLGSYAVESIRDRLRSIIEEIEDWRHLSFPVAEDDEKGKDAEDQDQLADGMQDDDMDASLDVDDSEERQTGGAPDGKSAERRDERVTSNSVGDAELDAVMNGAGAEGP